MVPPACIKNALMLSCVNPTWGPMIVVTARSAEVISVLLTVDHIFLLKMDAICVFGGGAVLS